MEKIYSNNTNNEKLFNKKLGTNYSYDKSPQQSPKLHSNKIRPLSGNLYYNNFISKGTSLKKQMKRLTNEELFNIIGPLNKKAGNINKYKKRKIKDFLGDKKIKIKTEINNNEERKNKLQIEINELNNRIKSKEKRNQTQINFNNKNKFNYQINSDTRKSNDRFLPKGYLKYEYHFLNNNDNKKERVYDTSGLKQISNESDIFFLRAKSQKEAQRYTNKDKARNYSVKLGSDIFNSKNDINNLMKSGELYLFKKTRNPFKNESNSFWASKITTPTYMNYPSVEYNILNPDIKNNTKTREKIYKEVLDNKLMNPIFKQKSISTFYDITRVGMNRNLTYQKLYEENKKIFYKNDNVCTSQYDAYQNYKNIVPKPFFTQVNKNVYV